MTLFTAHSAPGTTITTTSETLAANIPATMITPPANATGLVIRGIIVINAGASTASIGVKLRVGLNNTSTAQVDTTQVSVAVASASNAADFEFTDTNIQDWASGYSLTVVQNSATGNGTITTVDYDVDIAVL